VGAADSRRAGSGIVAPEPRQPPADCRAARSDLSEPTPHLLQLAVAIHYVPLTALCPPHGPPRPPPGPPFAKGGEGTASDPIFPPLRRGGWGVLWEKPSRVRNPNENHASFTLSRGWAFMAGAVLLARSHGLRAYDAVQLFKERIGMAEALKAIQK
jgi:hypothetical protein